MRYLNWIERHEPEFNSIPNEPGVYIIAVFCTDGFKYAVYCGQAVDLQRRIKQHWSKSEPNTKLRQAIADHGEAFSVFYATTSETNLDSCEAYLFDYYNPQFGERSPDTIGMEISLPGRVKNGNVHF